MLGKKRELGFWSVVAGLLPLAYASSYAAVGMTKAEGCSGASFEETGVTYLSAAAEAPVATDGFFPFQATTVNIESGAALAQIAVEVRDSDGTLVPGETQLLSKETGKDGIAYLQLGWSASGAAREKDEELSFHAEAIASLEPVTLERTLTVVGEAPELTLPSFEVIDWISVKYDAGDRVTCSTWADCDSYHAFGSELHDAWEMMLAAPKVTPSALVVWEFEWEPVPDKGRFVENPGPFDWQSVTTDAVLFAAGEEEFCARLRGHDLHTGETKEQDFCGSPSGDRAVVWDAISECSEPPDGYLERWCLAVENDSIGEHPTECAPYLDPQTGTGGAATGGAGGEEPSSSKAGKGGTGSAGRPSPSAGAGTRPLPTGEPGSGGSPPGHGGEGPSMSSDGGRDVGALPGEKRTLTEAGCACRAASNDERDSALGCVGLAVVALGLGTRRRRIAPRGR